MSAEGQNIQFTHSNVERRVSVVYASVGKQGLFLPKDFLRVELQDNDVSVTTNDRSPLLDNASFGSRLKLSVRKELLQQEREIVLNNHVPYNENDDYNIALAFGEAVLSKKIKTASSMNELKVLAQSSIPLVITFLLQNSLSTVSVFSVGHLGASELAAVSIGAMTANISGYATIQGVSTALDTLCPQAFGAKKYHLVGVYMQKCIAMNFVIILPVLFIWAILGKQILILVMPDETTAEFAAQYLLYLCPGIPAYILFECGKRFLQAQGIFHVSTFVLLIAAPSNLLMNLVFVRKFGFIGAPIAVSINYWLMFLGLLISTVKFTGYPDQPSPLRCWDGLQLCRAFLSWGTLVTLAVPGWIMLEAEFLAFEILTLIASYLGTKKLGAQAVGLTIASLTYQVPFAIGIASSTRIANYLGAGLGDSAKTTTKVAISFGFLISVLNFSIIYIFQTPIASLFTKDDKVIAIIKDVMWLVALMQISDATNAISAGCLRGQGQTKIGGIVNLISYYIIGIPLSIYLALFSPWKGSLSGLWIGTTVALSIIGIVQTYYSLYVDFDVICEQARKRTTHSANLLI
ncbi:ethionine resistance protein [Metschnikowia bicuspidata]|uniref:Ethionine resistance protein n=1 Tax=Metschnikowia bicuspidata TaxID=27322 RepID=A0A4P9ZEK4_9ASCO|nr:ethionine resistance protein [Metschnikowia bicuspidata]